MENAKTLSKTDQILRHIWKERRLDIVILALGLFVGAYFQWNIVDTIVFLIFLWSFLGPIPSGFLAVPALFFLSVTPFLIAFDRKEQAESFAVYAYYFLAMAVIRGIAEVSREKEAKKEVAE